MLRYVTGMLTSFELSRVALHLGSAYDPALQGAVNDDSFSPWLRMLHVDMMAKLALKESCLNNSCRFLS